MAKKGLYLLLAGLFVLLAACQAQPETTPTPTNIPTKQLTATETLWPTITAVLTATPMPPTATVEAPDILKTYFVDPSISTIDSFENLQSWTMWNPESVRLSDGEVTLTGQPDWNSALALTKPITENQGIMLIYKALNNWDSKAEFVFVSGEFQSADFRQFGIYNGPSPKSDLYQGPNGIGFTYLHGNYAIQKDTWQTLIMAVDDQANFIAIIYNPENPNMNYLYTERLGETWKDMEWEFRITATESEIIFVKNFQAFTFTDLQN